MPTKLTARQRFLSSKVFFTFFFYYARICGMTVFDMSKTGRLETSRKVQLVSVSVRFFGLLSFVTYFLPNGLDEFLNMKQIAMRVMAMIQGISIILSILVCFVFQTVKQRQFIDIVNRAIDVAHRISRTDQDFKFIGIMTYVLIVIRFFFNISQMIAEFIRLSDLDNILGYWNVPHTILRTYLWFGTLILVDVLCLGFVLATTMYENIGQQLKGLVERVEGIENLSMTRFRRMQTLCDFSEELDRYAEVYSTVYKLTNDFHKLLELFIVIMLYTDFVILIGNIHHTFLIYMDTGSLKWSLLFVSGIQGAQVVFYLCLVDRAVRSSRIPKQLNLDLIASDEEPRWDKSVDQFLNQLRFQDLSLGVYGLFKLNNELLLQGFSAIVSYLTILIQFQMLGLFNATEEREVK